MIHNCSTDGTAAPGSAVSPAGRWTTSSPPRNWSAGRGGGSITSADDLAAVDDPFESDVEYEEFLADFYASRRAGLASA